MQVLVRHQISGIKLTGDLVIREETQDHPGYSLYLTLEGEQFVGDGEDMFEALLLLRKQLESIRFQILLNGAARNVWPSPMARSMGDGRLAERMTLGQPTRREDRVDILDSDRALEPVSIAEQEAFLSDWHSSLGLT